MTSKVAQHFLADAFTATVVRPSVRRSPSVRRHYYFGPKQHARRASRLQEAATSSSNLDETVSLYKSEGIFAVSKPLTWTSQDVVGYTRKMLERDCKERGVHVEPLKRRGNKKRMLKVGHGGTLDPLATGVLVIGVGKGTKLLQAYLNGPKRYTASAKLGFETTTDDMEGEVLRTAPYEHVTREVVEHALPSFRGTILQVPPIFSAIKRDGKKMYEQARAGKTAEDLAIPPREVTIYHLELCDEENDGTVVVNQDDDHKGAADAPTFGLDVECGGGTYIRSLVKDIGVAVGSAATMTGLVRTQQGPFKLEHVLAWEDLTPDNIYDAIDRAKAELLLD